MSLGNGLHDFLGLLMNGLRVVLYTLEHIEFGIQSDVFSLVDFITYGTVISATLRFISSRYKGSWRGDHKQINRNVER